MNLSAIDGREVVRAAGSMRLALAEATVGPEQPPVLAPGPGERGRGPVLRAGAPLRRRPALVLHHGRSVSEPSRFSKLLPLDADDDTDERFVPRISLVLANADEHFCAILCFPAQEVDACHGNYRRQMPRAFLCSAGTF